MRSLNFNAYEFSDARRATDKILTPAELLGKHGRF